MSSKTCGPITAVAYANIALAKYWGKAEARENLPAVSSLSLTLDGLQTVTRVEFLPSLRSDEANLDGVRLTERPLERVVKLLDTVRTRAGIREYAQVTSTNHFPTAAGLASSASGFAALASAASAAAGLRLSSGELSDLARQSSASAARSLFGGYAALPARATEAKAAAPRDQLPVEMLIAVTERGPKSIGSTEAMIHTAQTSPLYPAWVASSEAIYLRATRAVHERDLVALGGAMEQSALAMHATMMAADPAILYFSPTTLRVTHWLRQERREQRWLAFFTMDAGPHVKILCHQDHATAVSEALKVVPGVREVLRCAPGPAASVIQDDTASSLTPPSTNIPSGNKP